MICDLAARGYLIDLVTGDRKCCGMWKGFGGEESRAENKQGYLLLRPQPCARARHGHVMDSLTLC